ncbi:hypothetical protein LCGC14_2810500 [marine sediment metagenome]|uniref:Uncharacterized protein n=1 Tax=marine sediment metagenome TaxID=412755 RepID=A0A0F8YJZ7_9ZZZZ
MKKKKLLSMKRKCPHHPEAELVAVQIGGANGVDGLGCPKADCKYEVVIDKRGPDVDFLQAEEAVQIRLASIKLRTGADDRTKLATWEFRLPLRTELANKLSLPRIMKQIFVLMDKPDGLRKAELDYELEGQNIEMRLYPGDNHPVKLKNMTLTGFRLAKVEHRGKGTAEDLIHLRFLINSEIDKKTWNWLHDALSIMLDVRLETAQLELPES